MLTSARWCPIASLLFASLCKQVKREWCEKNVLAANATSATAAHKGWCEVRDSAYHVYEM